jgi:uncharacterized membrane protein
MERILVVIFDNEKKAYEGAAALRELERDGSIAVYAGAVVLKNADGTTSVKQVDDLDPIGTLVGTSVGGLIGLLAGPVGMAIGAAAGLTLGTFADIADLRVGDDFVEDASQSLTANKVAVIAEVDEGWTTPVDTRMEALGGLVIRRGLSEVLDEQRQAQIAAMKGDLVQLKEEIAKANAERKAKLQSRIDYLQARIDQQQKKAQQRLDAFKARRSAKREGFKKNAAAAGHALRELAKTPPV